MSTLDGIKGALVDIDGTLMDADRAIPGAARAIDAMRAQGVLVRLVTNTSRRPRSATAAVLRREGFRVEDHEVLAPCVLARRHILTAGPPRAALLVPEPALADFDGIERDDRRPAWIVLGDIGSGFTYERLNQAFTWIRSGARLLALHRNRFWDPGSGDVLDVGAFVAALEFATGVEAETIGKPARAFFELALADLGVAASDAVVVGDDLAADIRGGASAGCRTLLVLTGKTRRTDVAPSGVHADLVLDSIASIGDVPGA